jgi:predicted MFS family arabinose efflux permease
MYLAIRHRVEPRATASSDFFTTSNDAARSRGRFWGALASHLVFRRLWLAMLSSSAGQWMQQVALGWLAIVVTDSPGFVGIVTFAGGVPFIVIAPLGGTLIDRVDRRRLMLVCQALACLLAVALAIDVIAGFIQPWHLVVAAFLNGSLQAILSPTQQSLVPSLVPRGDLTNAIGLMSAGQNMTRVVGPSIAGVVIGAFGVGPTYLVQAVAIALSFLLVLTITLPPRAARATGGRGVFEGIRLIASRPDLRGLFLLVSIPMLFVFPYIGFLNVFARDIFHIGAQGLGVLMAVSGVGAVVGSLLVASAKRIEGAGRILIGMTVAYGFVIVGVAFSRVLWITLPLLFLGSLLGAAFMSGNNVLIQHRVADDVRGRVTGAYMLTWGLMPIGALPMGLAADRFGTPTAVAAGAIISTVLAALLGLSSPVLREL